MSYSYISDGLLFNDGIPYWGLPKLVQYSGLCDLYAAVDVNHNVWSINLIDHTGIKQLTTSRDVTSVYLVNDTTVHAILTCGNVAVIDIPTTRRTAVFELPSKATKIGRRCVLTENKQVYSMVDQTEIYPEVVDCMVDHPSCALLPSGKMNPECDLRNLETVIGFGVNLCWTSDGCVYGITDRILYLEKLPEPENIVCISDYTDAVHVLYKNKKLLLYNINYDDQPKVIHNVEAISDFVH